jgi:hypothetical protein
MWRSHIPADWPDVSINNISMPHGRIALILHRSAQSLDLEIHNDGRPVKLLYEPELPLGAQKIEAEVHGRVVNADVLHFSEEDQAHLEINVPSGSVHCLLRFLGGVSIILPPTLPQLGDASTGMKINSVKWSDHVLHIDADLATSTGTSFEIKTPFNAVRAEGAVLRSLAEGLYELTADAPPLSEREAAYRHVELKIEFVH